jgi:hypothetical protein
MALSSSLQSQAAQVFSTMTSSPLARPLVVASLGEHLAPATAVEIFSYFSTTIGRIA